MVRKGKKRTELFGKKEAIQKYPHLFFEEGGGGGTTLSPSKGSGEKVV